eukprot:378616-Amphidinium_carterae.1
MVHAASGSPGEALPAGQTLRFLHSSKRTAQAFIQQNGLGSRYLFSSPMSAAFHRMTHHHYGLSNAQITEPGFIVLGVAMSQEYLTDHATPVSNGFSASESVNLIDLSAAQLKLHSCIQ